MVNKQKSKGLLEVRRKKEGKRVQVGAKGYMRRTKTGRPIFKINCETRGVSLTEGVFRNWIEGDWKDSSKFCSR